MSHATAMEDSGSLALRWPLYADGRTNAERDRSAPRCQLVDPKPLTCRDGRDSWGLRDATIWKSGERLVTAQALAQTKKPQIPGATLHFA